jgi:hypothetical protein
MNDLPHESGRQDVPPDPQHIPEVTIGNGDEPTATGAGDFVDPLDVDTSWLGSEDVADVDARLTDAGVRGGTLAVPLEIPARPDGVVDAEVPDPAIERIAQIRAKYEAAREAREAADLDPAVQAGYDTLHRTLCDSLATISGVDTLPARGAAGHERTIAEEDIPTHAREALQQVPMDETTQSVGYAERRRVDKGREEWATHGTGPRTDRAEVSFVRQEQLDGLNRPREVTVTYAVHRPSGTSPDDVPYRGGRSVSAEQTKPSPYGPQYDEMYDRSIYAGHPELADVPIDPAEAAEVATYIETATAPPEIDTSTPATAGDMQRFHDAISTVTSYRPGMHSGTYSGDLAPEDIPSSVREAFDAFPLPEGSTGAYRQHISSVGHTTDGQREVTRILYGRNESSLDGQATRQVNVDYRVTYTPGIPGVEGSEPRHTLTRTAAVTYDAHAPLPPAITAYGGHEPRDGTATERRVSRAEAQEVVNHAVAVTDAAPPTEYAREYTPPPMLSAEEMAALPMAGTVDMLPPPDPADVRVLQVNIGGNERAYAAGMIDTERGQRVLECTSLHVAEGYEGMGLEPRLISGLAAMAVQRGADAINAFASSPGQIDAYSSIATNVGFYSDIADDGSFVSPMTRDEALAVVSTDTTPEKGVHVRIKTPDLIHEKLVQPNITGPGANLL